MLNLPVPEKAGSGTDHEDLDELESGLRSEDKYIRDARYGWPFIDSCSHSQGELEGGRNWIWDIIEFNIKVDQSKILSII